MRPLEAAGCESRQVAACPLVLREDVPDPAGGASHTFFGFHQRSELEEWPIFAKAGERVVSDNNNAGRHGHHLHEVLTERRRAGVDLDLVIPWRRRVGSLDGTAAELAEIRFAPVVEGLILALIAAMTAAIGLPVTRAEFNVCWANRLVSGPGYRLSLHVVMDEKRGCRYFDRVEDYALWLRLVARMVCDGCGRHLEEWSSSTESAITPEMLEGAINQQTACHGSSVRLPWSHHGSGDDQAVLLPAGPEDIATSREHARLLSSIMDNEYAAGDIWWWMFSDHGFVEESAPWDVAPLLEQAAAMNMQVEPVATLPSKFPPNSGRNGYHGAQLKHLLALASQEVGCTLVSGTSGSPEWLKPEGAPPTECRILGRAHKSAFFDRSTGRRRLPSYKLMAIQGKPHLLFICSDEVCLEKRRRNPALYRRLLREKVTPPPPPSEPPQQRRRIEPTPPPRSLIDLSQDSSDEDEEMATPVTGAVPDTPTPPQRLLDRNSRIHATGFCSFECLGRCAEKALDVTASAYLPRERWDEYMEQFFAHIATPPSGVPPNAHVLEKIYTPGGLATDRFEFRWLTYQDLAKKLSRFVHTTTVLGKPKKEIWAKTWETSNDINWYSTVVHLPTPSYQDAPYKLAIFEKSAPSAQDKAMRVLNLFQGWPRDLLETRQSFREDEYLSKCQWLTDAIKVILGREFYDPRTKTHSTGADELVRFWINYMASMLQAPHAHPEYALTFFGLSKSGKTSLLRLAGALAGSGFLELQAQVMKGKFIGDVFFPNVINLLVDELNLSEDDKRDIKGVSSLKQLLTRLETLASLSNPLEGEKVLASSAQYYEGKGAKAEKKSMPLGRVTVTCQTLKDFQLLFTALENRRILAVNTSHHKTGVMEWFKPIDANMKDRRKMNELFTLLSFWKLKKVDGTELTFSDMRFAATCGFPDTPTMETMRVQHELSAKDANHPALSFAYSLLSNMSFWATDANVQWLYDEGKYDKEGKEETPPSWGVHGLVAFNRLEVHWKAANSSGATTFFRVCQEWDAIFAPHGLKRLKLTPDKTCRLVCRGSMQVHEPGERTELSEWYAQFPSQDVFKCIVEAEITKWRAERSAMQGAGFA